MFFQRLGVWLALTGAAVGLRADETNFWPAKVTEAGSEESWTSAGPFLFDRPGQQGSRISGFRPFYVQWSSVPHYGGELTEGVPLIPLPAGPGGTATDRRTVEEFTVLYPLFYYRDYGSTYSWSMLELIDRYGAKSDAAPAADAEARTFDVWPFYFSRNTGDPAAGYHALFPLGGTIEDKLWYQRIHFVLFPLYVQTERHGVVSTGVPWPFLRFTHGTETGFELWPLYGHRERPGEWEHNYWLWPFIWNNVTQPGQDVSPGITPGATHDLGVLPFYAATDGPDVTSRDYLWPFFGYTERRAPYRYHETRYFWPFLVQGRGDDHYRNRWGPFYTHSIVKGMDKTWAPWPLYRRLEWQDDNVIRTRNQFFYFVYWREEQRKVGHPEAQSAIKAHYWPLLSIWDNGAGRRQWQVPSPMEVFFPDNREMHWTWSPFFSLWQYDRQADGAERTSILWNAITWRRNRALGTSEFHLGPLVSFHRDAGGRRSWRFFSLAFPHARHNVPLTAAR